MQHLAGKTAVVTGAASGIGLGMARTFAREGMNVVLCDIHPGRLDAALAEVKALGAPAIAVPTDVSNRAAVEQAARRAIEAFGALHVVCNNAGVTLQGNSVAKLTPAEWDWIIGVNLYGVIHGIQTFLPLIQLHGQEGHIVNTASIAGFRVNAARRSGAYSTTKFAVVALSESLFSDLADTPVGVSVLAPAAVDTQIYRSGDNRPARFGGAYAIPANELMSEELRRGLHPDTVGERVVRAMRNRELYVFTHMDTLESIDQRHQGIRAAFDDCERWIAERGSGGTKP